MNGWLRSCATPQRRELLSCDFPQVMEIAKEVYVNGRPPEVPEALPQGIREVLLKCFRKNQAERATPEELRREVIVIQKY